MGNFRNVSAIPEFTARTIRTKHVQIRLLMIRFGARIQWRFWRSSPLIDGLRIHSVDFRGSTGGAFHSFRGMKWSHSSAKTRLDKSLLKTPESRNERSRGKAHCAPNSNNINQIRHDRRTAQRCLASARRLIRRFLASKTGVRTHEMSARFHRQSEKPSSA